MARKNVQCSDCTPGGIRPRNVTCSRPSTCHSTRCHPRSLYSDAGDVQLFPSGVDDSCKDRTTVASQDFGSREDTSFGLPPTLSLSESWKSSWTQAMSCNWALIYINGLSHALALSLLSSKTQLMSPLCPEHLLTAARPSCYPSAYTPGQLAALPYHPQARHPLRTSQVCTQIRINAIML